MDNCVVSYSDGGAGALCFDPAERDAYNCSQFNCSFCRNCTHLDDLEELPEELYEVPAGIIVLLSVFYGTISVVAVVGNSLVMWIVATSRRMQNVTNCYIANLALADIVIGLFAIPFQFQAALLQRWNLPHFMCPFCPFVQVLTVNVSVFTLTAIAVDRHRAILNPLSARPSKLRAKVSIALIWLVSGALATPMAVALAVDEVAHTDPISGREVKKPFCKNMNLPPVSMMVYRLVLVALQYCTPLCVISFVYARMALRLWGSRAPGNAQDSRDANIMKNKKKVIKMLVIVVALFALCWLPLQTYNFLQDMLPGINSYRYINIIFFCCDWLAMSNSCYNPFIYGIYNEKFKREFQQRFPFRNRRDWNLPGNTDSVDLDKHSAVHTRSSVLRSSYRHCVLQPAQSGSNDWRRAYSSRSNASRPRCYPPPPPNYPMDLSNGAPDSLYRPYAARLAVTTNNGQGGAVTTQVVNGCDSLLSLTASQSSNGSSLPTPATSRRVGSSQSTTQPQDSEMYVFSGRKQIGKSHRRTESSSSTEEFCL